MKTKISFFLIAILTVLFCLSATAIASQIWKIGAILSTTGHYAPLGTPEKEAMTALVDKINSQGGILGKKVKIIFEDDEGLPAKSIMLAKKLIYQDKVIGIVGPSTTASSMAASTICEEAQIPMVFMTPTKKVTKGKKYIFHVTPSSNLDAIVITRLLADKLNVNRVAILHGSSQYDMIVARLVTKQTKANPKLELVTSEKWGKGDKDMTPYLLNIRRKNPEGLVICGSAFGPAVAIRNLRDLKMDIHIICSSGTAQRRFLELGGEKVNGVYVTSRLVYGNPLPEEKAIFETIKKLYNVEPSSFHANGWDA
ncbi:MAG: ABC transporter substrate-binding protein, partial [Deltaproteobacteria bacterium]|nr:ABC transporter substrate-binding protein [Deltaproteobacteria bacterium]